jgi:hypothetical protein
MGQPKQLEMQNSVTSIISRLPVGRPRPATASKRKITISTRSTISAAPQRLRPRRRQANDDERGRPDALLSILQTMSLVSAILLAVH